LENDNQKSNQSYSKAIDQLSSISTPNNINDRIQSLILTNQSIVQCVNEFHQKSMVIGADDLIPIFIFILIHSNLKCIYSNLKILEDYIHPVMEISQGGYSIANLQLSVDYIYSMDVKNIVENNNEIIESNIIEGNFQTKERKKWNGDIRKIVDGNNKFD
jgi:hypothetical protein